MRNWSEDLTMQLFYAEEVADGVISLSESEATHAIKALRKNVGDNLHCVDGKGNLYETTITEIGKKKCICSINSVRESFRKRNYCLHIGIAPTKNVNRFEWFLEKATEIGVNEITPLMCQNSERKVLKLERLQKVLVSAMKQSNSAYLPKLNELTKIDSFFSTVKANTKLIAHCKSEEPSHAFDLVSEDTLFLIGPEGDFTEEEISNAAKNGFSPVSLGSSRLRTETAGISAAQITAIKNR